MSPRRITLSALLLAALSNTALAAPYCGDLRNAYGPFDIRVAPADVRDLVEHAHFTESVEAGLSGNTALVGGDLDYTLRAFPNHARALSTLIRMTQRSNTPKIPGAHYPTECYFERAVRFQPDDSAAWMLYARYLYVIGQEEKAMPMLERAVTLAPDDARINYNMGLALAKKKQFAAALPYAQKAYARAFPLPALKQMLVTAGVWVEPEPLPAEAAPDAPAPDASDEEAAGAAPAAKPAQP